MTRETTTTRGYGIRHQRLRAAWAAKVRHGDVACARCGDLIEPDEGFDLDHDDNDRTQYLGPSHIRCNRATARHRVEREHGSPLVAHTSRDWLAPEW